MHPTEWAALGDDLHYRAVPTANSDMDTADVVALPRAEAAPGLPVWMRFGILGSLEVAGPRGPVVVRGPKRRGLLAYLLVHAGEAVSLDRLIDDLWGHRPSSGAKGTVHSYVSGFRKFLGGRHGVALGTIPGGYVLTVPAECLDSARFERLCAQAEIESDAGERAELLDAALGLWRGAPLGEFAGSAWADVEATRLEALHLQAQRRRIDTRLGFGQHVEVIPGLQGLVGEHPLDEGFWAQLMVAYYRAGRQADALRAYQQVRSILGDELGIEPGAELASLERQILDHDPALMHTAEASAGLPAESLPEGVVTFLLTEIEDSTPLWDAHPEAMATAMSHHEGLVRMTVQAHGGRLVKVRCEGDTTVSVFLRASDAAAAALALQQAVAVREWPQGLQLRTKVALHTCEAHLRGSDYGGGTLNRAARIRRLAAGGQVLCSRATIELVAEALPAGVQLQPLGPDDVTALRRTETLYALGQQIAAGAEDGPLEPR